MKRAVKKYNGTLVKAVDTVYDYHFDEDGNEIGKEIKQERIFGIIGDFDKYKEKMAILQDTVELTKISDNVTLYKVDVKNSNRNLSTLKSIREKWAKGFFDYDYLYTKEQIKKLFEDECTLVAVDGLQEIDFNDLHLLD